MAFDVAAVTEAARDLDPAFDELSTPPRPLRRYLGRYRDSLVADLIALYVDLVLCLEEVELPIDEFDRGADLPDHLFVRGDRVWYTATRFEPFRLAQPSQLDNAYHRGMTGAVVDGHLRLAGDESDWSNVTKVTLQLVPCSKPLTDQKSGFDPLPSFAEDALVTAAAYFMARRAPGVDARPFLDDRNDARERLLTTATSQRRAAPLKIREGG